MSSVAAEVPWRTISTAFCASGSATAYVRRTGVMGRLLFVQADSVGSLIRGGEQPWSILLDWTYRWTRRISALSTVTVDWCWRQRQRRPPRQSQRDWRRHRSVNGSWLRLAAWH